MTTARTTPTIVDALRDRRLFGAHPSFRDLSSWRSWLVFLRCLFGLPLDPTELAVFRERTGRTEYRPPPGGYREAVAVVGRGAGKTRQASLLASFVAAFAEPLPDRTPTHVVLVSQNLRSVQRVIFSYVRSMFDPENVPILAGMVVGQTADSITLSNGVVLACWPCVPRSVRGPRMRLCVLDEVAHFLSTENYPVDDELVKAIRPALMHLQGRLVSISSPAGQSGYAWRTYSKHFGRDDSRILVWQGASETMNPTLNASDLAAMRDEDPVAFQNEVEAKFAAGSLGLFDFDALETCVDTDRPLELPPAPGVRYRGFADMSGGRVDAAAVAIAHLDRQRGAAVVDVARRWPSPHDPERVTGEVCDLLRQYNCRSVVTDKYAASWVSQSYAKRGVTHAPSQLDRSALYVELLASVNSGRVELPKHERLLKELRGLQRRRGPTRDRVDHLPGQHDDVANAVAGAVNLALKRQGRCSVTTRGQTVVYG